MKPNLAQQPQEQGGLVFEFVGLAERKSHRSPAPPNDRSLVGNLVPKVDQIEIRGNGLALGDLDPRAGVRNIPDRAILREFALGAMNNLAAKQHAPSDRAARLGSGKRRFVSSGHTDSRLKP